MKDDTTLVRAGRDTEVAQRAVNPAIIRASTVIYRSAEQMYEMKSRRETGERLFTYGARGTPTSFAFEDALCELEGGDRAFLYPSGLTAIAAVFLSLLMPNDHAAIIDTVYPPVRHLCECHIVPRDVEVSYFAPTCASLKESLRSNTKLIYVESPGSLTFEVVDLPAIAELAKACGAVLIVDNTWSAGYFYKPLKLGADISIQAATKYIGGHSDLMLGVAIARGAVWRALHQTSVALGLCASPDDAYTALRGLRSLGVRLRQHQESALVLAHWLVGRSEVQRVFYPALPGHPGHDIWLRDFTGASGLLSFAMCTNLTTRAGELVNSLELFGIGSSWGGYESLAVPMDLTAIRTAQRWTGPTPLIRLSVGLEDPHDLVADLEHGLDAVKCCA